VTMARAMATAASFRQKFEGNMSTVRSSSTKLRASRTRRSISSSETLPSSIRRKATFSRTCANRKAALS